MSPDTKKQLTLSKRHFFVVGKYVEDVKHDEKHIPLLLELIMRPPGLVKEELGRNLIKMTRFGSKMLKIRFQLFGFRKSGIFPPEANASLLTTRF